MELLPGFSVPWVKLASKADSQCLGQRQICRQSGGKVHMSRVGSYWWNKIDSKIKGICGDGSEK